MYTLKFKKVSPLRISNCKTSTFSCWCIQEKRRSLSTSFTLVFLKVYLYRLVPKICYVLSFFLLIEINLGWPDSSQIEVASYQYCIKDHAVLSCNCTFCEISNGNLEKPSILYILKNWFELHHYLLLITFKVKANKEKYLTERFSSCIPDF